MPYESNKYLCQFLQMTVAPQEKNPDIDAYIFPKSTPTPLVFYFFFIFSTFGVKWEKIWQGCKAGKVYPTTNKLKIFKKKLGFPKLVLRTVWVSSKMCIRIY